MQTGLEQRLVGINVAHPRDHPLVQQHGLQVPRGPRQALGPVVGRQALDQFFDEAGLGPEPWDLEPAYWRERLAATDRPLKAILLDQRVVAGVGNIYADESLFEARLHPARAGRSLTRAEAERLRRGIVTVLERAIERRGSSIRNYVGGSGLKGGYQEEFRVYGRTGEPCLRCRAPIERVRLAGRSTHYCPKCQKKKED